MSIALLCHCEGDAEGHELGAERCAETIKVRSYRYERTWPRQYSRDGEMFRRDLGACGTCPACQRAGLRVRGAVIRARSDATYPGRRRRAMPKSGRVIATLPVMAPHQDGALPCAGAGRVPAETRYTAGRELVEALREGVLRLTHDDGHLVVLHVWADLDGVDVGPDGLDLPHAAAASAS